MNVIELGVDDLHRKDHHFISEIWIGEPSHKKKKNKKKRNKKGGLPLYSGGLSSSGAGGGAMSSSGSGGPMSSSSGGGEYSCS